MQSATIRSWLIFFVYLCAFAMCVLAFTIKIRVFVQNKNSISFKTPPQYRRPIFLYFRILTVPYFFLNKKIEKTLA